VANIHMFEGLSRCSSRGQASTNIGLDSTRSRVVFVLVLLVAAAGYCAEAARVSMAAQYAASANPEQWRRAANLEPGNAAYWATLGFMEQWDLEHGDLRRAAANYERAVEVNPHSDRYWMELAGVYEALGEASRARAAYGRAQLKHPISAAVAWRYGHFLLRQGFASGACVQFRRALLADLELTGGAVAGCWKTDLYTSQTITEILPRQSRYYFKALDYFLRTGEIDAALRVWDGLVGIKKRFELAQAVPLVNDAISAGRIRDAQRVWLQALEISGWPRSAKDGPSLITNGGFEHDLANGGFDWSTQEHPDVSFSLDAGVAHSGARSLRISFNGESNLDFQHLVQYVPVEPSHRYRFTAYLRSSTLSTDSGIRFMIADPRHHDLPRNFTGGVTGTHPWRQIETEFITGPETRAVRIVLRRTPSAKFDNKLKGTVWVDDVSLLLAETSEKGPRP
jgi:tetratricopeptide (TPR) repeat protein